MTSTTKRLNEVHSVIVSLLTAEKKSYGIDVIKFDQMYKCTEGERIPYRSFGFSSLSEFLRTVSGVEIQQVNGGGHVINFTGKESTRHLSELIAKQKSKIAKNNKNRFPNCRPIASHFITRSRTISPKRNDNKTDEIFSIIQEYPKGLSKSELLKIYLQRHPYSNMTTYKLLSHLQTLGSKIMVRENMVYLTRNLSSVRSSTLQTSSLPPNNENNVFNVVKDNVKTNGIIPSNFKVAPDSADEDDYNLNDGFDYVTRMSSSLEKCNGFVASKDVPKQTISNSVEKTVLQDPQNFEKNKINVEEHTVTTTTFASENKTEIKTFDENDFIFSQKQEHIAALLNKRTQFRLEKLIQNNPDGIWCIDLPKKYREEYKISLDWENLGFQRIGDFVAYLPHIFYMDGPFSNGDYRLYYAKSSKLPQSKNDKSNNELPQKLTLASLHNIYNSDYDTVEAVPSIIPLSLSNKLVPDDVMTNGESVGQISVSTFNICNEIGDKKSIIPARVVEAFSPSFFWIHIDKKQHIFEDMMNKLHDFYEENRAKYSVPIIMLEKGLNIACKYYGKWHRGIIKAIDHKCRVTIVFYDYGTLKSYPPEDIFYLHRKFSALPAQAIPCGLYNVKSLAGDQWPKNVIDSFINRVYNRSLWAAIGKIDLENNSLLISLTDTSKDDDFHIADWMFAEKMARPGHMDISDPDDLDNYVEDLGECQQVCNPIGTQQNLSTPAGNTLELPPGISTDTVDDLYRAISVVEKKQDIMIETIDSINKLSGSIQKIVLRHFEFISNTRGTLNSEILVNMSETLAKIIMDSIYSTLNIKQLNSNIKLIDTKLSSLNDEEKIDSDEVMTIKCSVNQSETCRNIQSDDNLKDTTNSMNTPQHDVPNQNQSKNIVDEAPVNETQLSDDKTEICDSSIETDNNIIDNDTSNIMNKQQTINKVIDEQSTKVPLRKIITDINTDEWSSGEISDGIQELNAHEEKKKFDQIIRYKLEKSITHSFQNFWQKLKPIKVSNNIDTEQESHTFIKELHDTNPFKKDIQLNTDTTIIMKNSSLMPTTFNKTNSEQTTINNYINTKKSASKNFLLPVQLSCDMVYIFHLNEVGWISVDQFRSSFTTFGDNEGLYQFMNIAVPNFSTGLLKRSEDPEVYNLYKSWIMHQSTELQQRESNKSDDIALIKLNRIISILNEMSIITKEEIDYFRKYDELLIPSQSHIMADVAKLINTYRNYFK